MGLIGLGVVTVVAIVVAVRARKPVNKALVTLFWGAYAAQSLGWSL